MEEVLNQADGTAPCPYDCAECDSGRRLHLLAQKLTNRGLNTRIVTSGAHDTGISVTNPGAPGRGTFYVESDGCTTWEHSGSLDDDGIGRIVDEAINALRANGMRLPKRQPTS
jgi:hypothetical protein